MSAGPEALIRSFYAAVAAGDEARVAGVLHPEWEEIPPAYPGQPSGPGGYIPVVRSFVAAFPDARFDILEIIPAHPKHTVRTMLHGTHRGPFLGREPTGKRVAFATIDIHEVEGGAIRRSWHIEDFAAFFEQIDGGGP